MSVISVTKVAKRILLPCEASESALRYRRCVGGSRDTSLRRTGCVAGLAKLDRAVMGMPAGWIVPIAKPGHPPGLAPLNDVVAGARVGAAKPCRSALRRFALLLHDLLRALFQFRRRDVLDVRAEEPGIACRVLHAA